MISPEKVAACPFCGGNGILVPVPTEMQADCVDVYVRCEACDAMGPSVLFERGSGQDDPHPMAVAAWNARAPSPELLTLRTERDEADPSAVFAQWINKGPKLAKAAGVYVGITVYDKDPAQ